MFRFILLPLDDCKDSPTRCSAGVGWLRTLHVWTYSDSGLLTGPVFPDSRITRLRALLTIRVLLHSLALEHLPWGARGCRNAGVAAEKIQSRRPAVGSTAVTIRPEVLSPDGHRVPSLSGLDGSCFYSSVPVLIEYAVRK